MFENDIKKFRHEIWASMSLCDKHSKPLNEDLFLQVKDQTPSYE